MRVGIGYDVHAWAEDSELILGGVQIPSERGLAGHSDADVLVHAVMDALLGAAKLGDIGVLFPDSDETYRGADSLDLLQEVGLKLEESMYVIENIDATIVLQEPKLRPFIAMMETNIAMTLGLDVSQVSVKATTEEHLGFTGRGEGVKAFATCAIESMTRLMEESLFDQEVGGCNSGGCAGCSGCGSM